MVPAGVLVPVVEEDDGSLSMLFTRRTMKVKDHKGQVSFPGGVAEEGDATLLDTALRETREEIGLAPDLVRVVGRLRPYDTITGYRIHPFVGLLRGRPRVTPSDVEIDEVFFVGMATLMDEATFRESSVEWEGEVYTVRAYEWGGPLIWGATANILSELIGRLRS
jgi:8-oxo-dGTP pyrophosphatase MutT (NUDIX family)